MEFKVFEGSLPLVFIQEGDQVIAYCPALELSSCGGSLEEAHRRWSEAFHVFMEEVVRKGTLEDVLQEYGWIKITDPTPRWSPPQVIGHIDEKVKIHA